MKKIKLSYSKILELQKHINGNPSTLGFKTKATPLGWAAVRSGVYIDKVAKIYYELLAALINLHSEKDQNNKNKLKEGTTGAITSDFIYKDPDTFMKDYKELVSAEIEVEIYEATKEKVNEYINTNPAPSEYEIFIDNVINPEFID